MSKRDTTLQETSQAAKKGLLREAEVLQLVPFGRSTLRAKVAEGTFPAPFGVGRIMKHPDGDRPSLVAWDADEVADWVEAQKVDANRVRWAGDYRAPAQAEA